MCFPSLMHPGRVLTAVQYLETVFLICFSTFIVVTVRVKV